MKNIRKILIIGIFFLALIFVDHYNKLLAQGQGGSCGSTYVDDASTVTCVWQTNKWACPSGGDGGTNIVRNCYNQGGGCNAAYVSSSVCDGLPYGCTVNSGSGLKSCTSTSPTNTPVPTCAPNWPACDTTCSTARYQRNDTCGNYGWCEATAACCAATDPDTPVLSAPASGTTVNMGSSVNLDWNAISSWGISCPSNTNTYEVCVESGGTCNKLNTTGISSSTTIQSWTPATGGYTASWKVSSYNGSNRATSLTRTLCIENELCPDPQCGEDRFCSTENCLNTDNGVPVAATIVSPNGTSGSPTPISGNAPQAVILSWNATAKAERYLVILYNSAGTPIWNPAATAATSATTLALASGVYHWSVSAVNDTCTVGQIGTASTFGYFRVNSQPTISNLVIKNSAGTPVAAEAGNRNHICQSSFTTRQVLFEVTLTDPDGWNDISSAQLQWNGNNYPLVLGAGLVNSRKGTFTKDYSGVNDGGVYMINGIVSDPYINSGWIALNRSWKVWDCQVPTYGSLYGAKDGVPTCSTTSAGSYIDANKIESGVGFNSITFSDTPNVTMNDNDLNSYGTNSIVWGKTYLPLINGVDTLNIDGTLLATGRMTRIVDLGVGTTTCPNSQFTINNANISAYSASPQAKIDFSFIQDQEAWYQVVGAGVKSAGPLRYGVPVTVDDSLEALTLSSDLLNVENGLVSATNLTNINGNNEKFGIAPRNWYVLRNTNDLVIYDYDYFYDNFFVKTGVGVTGTNWAEKPLKGIYFVKNSLNIDNNFVLANPSTETMMVVVNGDITIQPGVTSLDGIYIANGWISAGGNNATALTINGMLYARDSVRLNRSFTDKTINNTAPAVKVNYSPGLIFNLDPKILRVLSGWREE